MRIRTYKLLALCIISTIAFLVAPALAQARTEKIRSIAYSFLINRYGGWTGPENLLGDPQHWVVDSIIAANPSHLRITDAANTCEPGECFTMQPKDNAVARQLRELRDAGIKLGTAINIAHTDGGRKRSVQDVVDHACKMKQADDENLYSWIFLDFSSSQPKRLEIANKIRSGKGCPAGGWRIMTNSSGYKKSYHLARGALAHAKRFSLLVGGSDSAIKERLVEAARGQRPILTDSDHRFLEDVKKKYPEAYPVLKLEVPNQVAQIFAELPTDVQSSLIEKWARGQERNGYKMIYPLFVFPGNHPPYNSLEELTYQLMVSLMALDSWKL